jgi:hypothetical protein
VLIPPSLFIVALRTRSAPLQFFDGFGGLLCSRHYSASGSAEPASLLLDRPYPLDRGPHPLERLSAPLLCELGAGAADNVQRLTLEGLMGGYRATDPEACNPARAAHRADALRALLTDERHSHRVREFLAAPTHGVHLTAHQHDRCAATTLAAVATTTGRGLQSL